MAALHPVRLCVEQLRFFCLVITDGANTRSSVFLGRGPRLLDLIEQSRKIKPRKGRRKEPDMAKRKEIKWRWEARGTMNRTAERDHFSDLSPVGHAGAGTHRKLLRHKGIRKNDQHGGLQKIHLGGGPLEFCQAIAAGEIDLEDLRAEFAAIEAERERQALRKAVEEAKEFRGPPGGGGNFIQHPAGTGGAAGKPGKPGTQRAPGFERGEGWPDGT